MKSYGKKLLVVGRRVQLNATVRLVQGGAHDVSKIKREDRVLVEAETVDDRLSLQIHSIVGEAGNGDVLKAKHTTLFARLHRDVEVGLHDGQGGGPLRKASPRRRSWVRLKMKRRAKKQKGDHFLGG